MVEPGDAAWDAARRGFAARADYDAEMPRAVVFCRSAEEVIEAIRWARKNGVPIRARCGRHGYEAQSSLARGGLIVDVSEINFVRFSADGRCVMVGAGGRVGDLYTALGRVGAAIPLATGASVGVAGLTLGGGFGMTSRLWGLTCDSLEAVEIVLADGSLATVSETECPDLFWACRGGGGGNFGIVTSLTFQLHPARGNVAVFSIGYSWEMFDSVVDRFQHWMQTADFGATAFLTLLGTREIALQGQFTPGSDVDADLSSTKELLAPLLDAGLRPLDHDIRLTTHLQAARAFMEVDPATGQAAGRRDAQIFKSTGAFVYGLLPDSAITVLRRGLEAVPALSMPPSQPSMVQLLGGGGQIARIAPGATAAYHREARLLVQYNAYWTADEDAAAALAWIRTLRALMLKYTRGAYVNYMDYDLGDDPLELYYGGNLPRLQEIKRTYDPDKVFSFPHGIPVASGQ